MVVWNPRTEAVHLHSPEVHAVLLQERIIMSRIHCPSLLTYFEGIGYDVSIIVSKWFITLFAYVLFVKK